MNQVREAIHRELLKLRRLERLVDSRQFEDMWEAANIDQRNELELISKSFSLDDQPIIKWTQRRRITLLGEHTYAELRDMARNAQVPRYSRMSKGELLSALSKLEKS